MKKKLTRLFSVLLAAVLVLGTLPVSAMGTDVADPPASAVDDTPAEVSAAEPEEASVVDETPDGEKAQSGEVEIAEVQTVAAPALEDKPYNIFFLDCGRKYYSVDSIEKLIDNASAAGFNYIQLAVGNDGLRFLLDDMSLTVNGTTYDSTKVSSAIHAGNEAYYNFDVDELTQSEMDTIIAYANDKGMGVIPCVNSPGHMDAILSAANSLTGKTCSYNRSVRTIDVTNDTAVAFTQELLQKYITYFAGKGCKLFNMGADEYANDIYTGGSMGFGNLQSNGKYSYYVQYVNQVAAMIKTAGMNPMAFNDGIYFGNNTSSGTFDKDIIVCYWSNGWPGYTPMPASDLAAKGFKLINTNGSYYWVLGKSDAQCDETKASGFDRTAFPGDSTIKNPLGSMFCIWADYPGAETEESVITKTAATIAAFGKTLPKDGIVISDAANNDGQLETGGTMVLTANKQVDWTTSDASVASIAPSDPEAVMAAVETGAVNATAITVTAKKAGSATITATAGNKSATYAVTVNDPGKKNVTVTVGKTVTLDPVAGKAEIQGEYDTSVVDVIADHKQTSKKDVYTKKSFESMKTQTVTLLDTADSSIKPYELPLTIEYDPGFFGFYASYYLKNGDRSYICPTKNGAEISDKTSVDVVVNSDGSVTISKTLSDKTYYLTVNKDGSFGSTTTKTSLYAYEKTTTGEDRDDTTISFTGKKVGKTSVKIGEVTYIINVTAEDLTQVTPLTIEYWITNAKVSDANSKTEMQLAAQDVYSEEGTNVATLVPARGTKGSNNVVFLKATRLTSDNKQTTENGVDRTTSGYDFNFVRFWNSRWEISKDGEAWETVASTDQIVAYYLQETKVTTEVDTNVTDWGEIYSDWKNLNGNSHWFWTQYVERAGSSGHNFVFMDFAVVYEDGTQNPSSFPVDNTMFFHADSLPRKIGYMNFDENENYEIWKVTVTDGTCSGNSSASTFKASYNDKTEAVVWDTSMGGEPHIDQIQYETQKTGKLIRVYVRAKQTEDSLTVNYIDDTNGETFYHYNIAVNEGTVFPGDFAFDGTKNVIKNIKNVNQTVTNNIKSLPEIQAQYRYSQITYKSFDLEKAFNNGYKVLNIHYTFDNNVAFVVDFGTPVKINPSDINSDLGAATVTIQSVNVEQVGTAHGEVQTNNDGSFTYTPQAAFASNEGGETLQVTYTGTKKHEDGTESALAEVTYQVYIYPASNVLYEENFLTGAEGWTDASVEHTTAQETQKAKEDKKNVFGYDGSYARATNNNGVWEATGLNTSALTKPLTTNFYGNTFDLIGNCAPDSGRVIMVIKGDDGKGRAVDVDTRYSSGTIYQVPLAHVVMGDTDKNYSVMIYASGLASKTDTDAAPRGVATMSIDDANIEADDLLAQVLEENGLSMDDVEYVSVSAMDNANVVTADDSDDAVAIYANDAKATAYQSGTHVEIDGFRVYRSTNDDVASNYPTNEKNVDYKRILDVVKGEITAYSDNNGQLKIDVQQYEANGGPQNEIYLVKGQSVFFQSNDLANKEVQVSLRAVNANATASVAGTQISLASNTEMYYTLKADETGKVTIVNNGTGLLAIGNVKLPKSVTTDSIQSASEAGDEAVITALKSVLYTDEEPEVFTPETFTAKTTVTPVVRNKMVTLKVNVSSDVAYITVNGVKYTRTGLQGLFRKTRTIRVVNTVKKGQTKTYEVVAYNADGVASETITVTG